MKQLTRSILLSSLLAVLMTACKKDENRVLFEGGTPPVLTASTSTINLSFANEANDAVRLNWTNPDYRFNTGGSSQDVKYLVEIDIAGNNFEGVNKQTVAISNDMTVKFTIGQFNDYLLNQLLLVPGVTRSVEIRVLSSLGSNSAVSLSSNKLVYSVTPYAIPPKVEPPSSGKLYITGAATPGDWMGDGAAELVSQKFTQISNTLYEMPKIRLDAGESYLFVPVYGNWSNKYGFIGSNNQNNVNGDDFKHNGGDMLSPAVAGDYKIVVDFQRGKFIVTKL